MNIDEPFASAGEPVNQGQDPPLETSLRLLRVVPMATARDSEMTRVFRSSGCKRMWPRPALSPRPTPKPVLFQV